MLLEVNDVRAVIVRAQEGADDDAWRTIARDYAIVVYASDVQQFNAWYDALGDVLTVLFWDTEAANEVAHNIKTGMETLNVQPFQTVYVTHDERDLPEALPTRVGTVQIGGTFRGVLADLRFDQAAELATALSRRRRGQDRGYVGEIFATMRGANAVWNGTGILTGSKGFLRASPVIDRKLADNLVVAVLGRYFPPREARHAKHQFSRRILAAKRCDGRAKRLFQPLGLGMRSLISRFGYDLLTRVPPKPSSEHDHVGWLLQEAARLREVSLIGSVDLDAIACSVDYPRQRDAGSHAQRAANVAEVFEAGHSARGHHILLIDDVITSGSTVASAAQTLLNAGAASVGVLALGFNQNRVHRLHEPAVPCPEGKCGGVMVLQLSRSTDAGFWGCSNWTSGCKKRMYFGDGLRALNALNRRDTIETVPDIGF